MLILILLCGLVVNAAVVEKEAAMNAEIEKRAKIRHHLVGDHQDEDTELDHDLFLGDDLKSEFDNLSPEESRRRLGLIVDRMDSDLNGLVSEEELNRWISQVQEREIVEDTELQWSERAEGKDRISWTDFKKISYGFLDENEATDYGGFNFTKMINRDRRRFFKADRNNDEKLDKEEFQAFLHPEDSPYLKEVVILETMEDMDSNNDGVIDESEYMADLWQGKPDEEPEWVQEERQKFHSDRDHDKDGSLNFQEVKDWISPDGYDFAQSEAHHLMVTVDADQDNFLTKEEILDKYDIFVGSQATSFGDILTRHEEF